MILLVKIALILCLLAICYQDIKDRMVYWFLFPMVGIGLGILHFKAVGQQVFVYNLLFNVVMVSLILGLLWGYSKFRFRNSAFTDNFGAGDIWLLYALCAAFAPIAFLTLLVFGLVFSLLLHVVLPFFSKSTLLSAEQAGTRNRKHRGEMHTITIPLAGYLALFFGVALCAQWLHFFNQLYLL